MELLIEFRHQQQQANQRETATTKQETEMHTQVCRQMIERMYTFLHTHRHTKRENKQTNKNKSIKEIKNLQIIKHSKNKHSSTTEPKK